MQSVLIIGHGVVGHNLEKEIKVLKPCIYDIKYHQKKDNEHYNVAFVCVDTPYIDKDTPCDITQVKNAIQDHDADIFVIKSTILPGTTDQLLKTFKNKHIIFSPEYYGGTQHCNNFDFPFTVLGGLKSDCLKVQQLLQNVYDARHKFYIVDSRTAELVKYMENSWLATKVSFCNQFYDIARKCGVDYETLRELFILDPRINPAHTFVYKDHPYWESHCLDKDVPAIANTFNAELLQAVIEFNKKRK